MAVASGITAGKIKASETILGVTGTYEGTMSQQEYNEAVNMANDILS